MARKKILIISMTAGFGHIRAGQALLDYAKEHLPQVDAEHIDIVTIDDSLKRFSQTYDLLSKKFPFLWRIVYEYLPTFFTHAIARALGLSNKKVIDYIAQKKPDAIIFTNDIILRMFSSYLKEIGGKVAIGSVVTDYHAHPYYKFPTVNYYFVPTTQVGSELEQMGVDHKKVLITGIPINPKFYVPENIQELKLKYGITNDLPVVLFIASFKATADQLMVTIKELLELKPAINLIFIANGNEIFYTDAQDQFSNHERFLAVTWTDVIQEYMKMADVVISKAGGLTVSECIALHKPLIMVSPIPGQEEYNAQFMEKNNFGKKVASIDEIVSVLPGMLLQAKHNQIVLLPEQNPCEKIFNAFV